MIHKSRLLFGLSLALLLSQYYCSSLIGYAVDDSSSDVSSSADSIDDIYTDWYNQLYDVIDTYLYNTEWGFDELDDVYASLVSVIPYFYLKNYINSITSFGSYTPSDSYHGVFAYCLSPDIVHFEPSIYQSFSWTYNGDPPSPPPIFDMDVAYSPVYSGLVKITPYASGSFLKYSYFFLPSGDLSSSFSSSISNDVSFSVSSSGIYSSLFVSDFTNGATIPKKKLTSSFRMGQNTGAFYITSDNPVIPSSVFDSDPSTFFNNVKSYMSSTFPDSVSTPLYQQLVEKSAPPTSDLNYNDLEYPPNIPAYTMPTYDMESHSIPESAISGAGFWFSQLQNFIENSGLMWLVVIVGLLTILFYLLRW